MKTLVDYALSFVGQPYKWGGDDPMTGWDCSGLLQEILASVGADPPGDQTSKTLHEHFLKTGRLLPAPEVGAVAFFGKPDITHCAFCIDQFRMVEAAGGGSKTRTLQDAVSHNAYVRVRPITSRRDIVSVIMPAYLRWEW